MLQKQNMASAWIAYVFVLFVFSWSQIKGFALAIQLDNAAAEYITKAVDEYKSNPKNSRYDYVVHPPKDGRTRESFFLPKLFIWCPMSHYDIDVFCPEHNIAMREGFFTDKGTKSSPRNPRLVYDLRGNVLLIQRMYICNHNGIQHRYLSASMELLQNLPPLYGQAFFPLIMFHKSACTKEVVDFIETQIIQGINFLRICEGIAALNFKEYCERVECHSISQGVNIPNYDKTYDGFYSNMMYAFPSNDKLMEIFMNDFQYKQPYYEEHMKQLGRNSKGIMCDHTFKVTKYIAASRRGSDNKAIRQFENLFVILNDEREIVGWRLTKTTAFEEIKDLLQDFSSILNNSLEDIVVDDCCKVRAQYQTIFKDVDVKLDLFHAVQRVIKTVPKNTEFSKQFSREFGLVFRAQGDCGERRNTETPESEVIERNLNNFISTWKHFLEEDVLQKTMHELENLRDHVRKGCLSGLRPGQGTECNERLHSTINRSLLCGSTTIGPEIAIAVLSLICFGINCKRTDKKHCANSKVTPFMPLPTQKMAGMSFTPKEYNVKAHFKTQEKADTYLDNVWRYEVAQQKKAATTEQNTSLGDIVVIENIQDMCNESVSALILRSTSTLHHTLQKMDEKCKDRTFNAFDIPIMHIFDVRNVLSNNDKSDKTDVDYLLKRNLASFSLCIEAVEGDGDCAFKSIIKQLRKTQEWNNRNEALLEHLTTVSLGRFPIYSRSMVLYT